MRARRTERVPAREHPTVVALPGLGLSADYLIPLAQALAPVLPTYIVDLPGSGGAPGPSRRLNAGDLADVVAQWLAVNELSDVLLFGNSYGSEVALETALRATGRTRGVVLGAPTPDPGARSLWRQFFRLVRAWAQAPPRLMAVSLRDYWRTGARSLLREAFAALDEPIIERLQQLGIPTLIVRGERDPVVPQRWAEEAARLARAELVVIDGAGHAAPFAQPEEVAAAITAFVERIT